MSAVGFSQAASFGVRRLDAALLHGGLTPLFVSSAMSLRKQVD
jgi:hypothetical protein